ncbi:ACP phosphodiesterase [Cytophagaceae bacterium YF14B1]|uniref:ACP phosphodiesterase n=1 Tax=Xanthocytophaga flava TaxID=3048013 RepID=A0AAE3QIP3_9BACT|nr:ACP phosphodiesterase [Xanthocytophaga flavus]MDJ1480042.1 ACP phosphodiesterase [Xanthocytophaga flavus]
MNFLAHLYLSGTFDEAMIGNLMADFITGRIREDIPEKIREGIVLHREIDSFTDSHPVVRKAKHHLFPVYRHYASVITDVFYDHFLATHWQHYHPEPLEQFAEKIYQFLTEKEELLPVDMLPVVHAMKRQNWLVNYGTLDGMNRTLTNTAKRTKFASGMEHAVNDLQKDYDFYQDNFREFFPDLVQHVERLKAA